MSRAILRISSQNRVQVDPSVGMKAMTSLQKARAGVPALANQDLSWLDDELSGPPAVPAPATPAPSVITNPTNPGDPNAEALKTKDNKRRKAKAKAQKISVWEQVYPTKQDKKDKWSG